MRTRSWAAVATLAMFGVACTSHPNAQAPETTPSATSSASSSATAPAGPAFQALVTRQDRAPGSTPALTLYDATTAAVTDVPNTRNPQSVAFVGQDRIAYVDQQEPHLLYSQALDGGGLKTEVTASGPIHAFAFAPDAKTLVYIVAGGNSTDVHLRAGGRDRVISRMPKTPATEFGRYDEARLEFSRSGTYFVIVDTFVDHGVQTPEDAGNAPFQVRTSDGTLVFSVRPIVRFRNGQATDETDLASGATWSANDALWYWVPDGVQRWDASTRKTTTVLGGVRWLDPAASPDGRQIVYDVYTSDGLLHLRKIDATAKTVAALDVVNRSHAVFVDASTVLAFEEVACRTGCEGSSTETTGITYLVDVVTSTEKQLPFSNANAAVRRP